LPFFRSGRLYHDMEREVRHVFILCAFLESHKWPRLSPCGLCQAICECWIYVWRKAGYGVLYLLLWRLYQWNIYRPIGDHVVDCCGSGFRRYSSVLKWIEVLSTQFKCYRGSSVSSGTIEGNSQWLHHTVSFWQWHLYLLTGVSPELSFLHKTAPFLFPRYSWIMTVTILAKGNIKDGDFQNEFRWVNIFALFLLPLTSKICDHVEIKWQNWPKPVKTTFYDSRNCSKVNVLYLSNI